MGKKPEASTWRIPKHDTGPAPGSYDVTTAIQKTDYKWHITSPPKIWSEKRINFTDTIAKNISYIPGPGKYKKVTEGHDLRSKSQLTKTLRH
jgi:hypothetical protein